MFLYNYFVLMLHFKHFHILYRFHRAGFSPSASVASSDSEVLLELEGLLMQLLLCLLLLDVRGSLQVRQIGFVTLGLLRYA